MTYQSRGRSIFEVVLVRYLCILLFSMTFFTTLCIVIGGAPIYLLQQTLLYYVLTIYRIHVLSLMSKRYQKQTKQKKAICFVAFLVGFITVLCIGNYFRAKRAQDRQRQRRDAKQQHNAAQLDSSRSNMHGGTGVGNNNKGTVEYEAPVLPQTGGVAGRLL